MKKLFFRLVFSAGVLLGLTGSGHTPAESNAVVRTILQRTIYFASLGPEATLDCDFEDLPNTWDRFLWNRQAGGWPLEAKQAAFDDYLERLGSIDCSTLDAGEKAEAQAAVSCCYSFCRTNSVPRLKRIALNPKGISRQTAIEAVVDFSPVGECTTLFVEAIVTNIVGYSRSERGTAWSHYSRRIQDEVVHAEGVPAGCFNAAMFYYGNRTLDIAGAVSIDKALLSCLPQYANSSNRLQTALYVIGRQDCYSQTRLYFTAVTNQLLSSGQPLRQLTIGAGAGGGE